MEIVLAIGAVVAIGLICGGILAVASKVMAVEEDERFPIVRDCLPGANCGACGYAGCNEYTNALLSGEEERSFLHTVMIRYMEKRCTGMM